MICFTCYGTLSWRESGDLHIPEVEVLMKSLIKKKKKKKKQRKNKTTTTKQKQNKKTSRNAAQRTEKSGLSVG